MIDSQTRKNNFFIKCLVIYYILFTNVPAVRYYVSTYVSIVLLAFLFVGIWDTTGGGGKTGGQYIAVTLLYLVLIVADKLADGEEFLLGVWQTLLEYLPLVLGFLLIRNKADNVIRTAIPLIFLTYIFTCITTYVGLLEYPTASRELATGRSLGGTSYTRLNIGGFEFIYSLVAVHPMLVYFLRKRKRIVYAVLATGLFASCVVASQYATALIGFTFSLAAYILPVQEGNGVKKNTWVRLAAILVVGFLLAPRILTALSEIEALSAVSEKLLDAANLLQGQDASMANTTSRQRLYALSFNTFLKYPFFGSEIMDEAAYGGHSWILDIMARWGLLGLAGAVALVLALAKWYRMLFAGSSAYYYVQLSLCLALVFAAVNPVFFAHTVGVEVPLLAYVGSTLPKPNRRGREDQVSCRVRA